MRKSLCHPVVFLSLGLLLAAGCAKQTVVKKDEMIPSTTTAGPAETKPVNPVAKEAGITEQQIKEIPATEETTLSGKSKNAFDSVYFTFDSYELDPAAREALAKDFEAIKRQPGIKVRIEGNCDEIGSAEYNLALGEKRALAAKKYLSTMGIAAGRLSTISYGKEKPLDPGHDETARSKNRRDDFVIVSK